MQQKESNWPPFALKLIFDSNYERGNGFMLPFVDVQK